MMMMMKQMDEWKTSRQGDVGGVEEVHVVETTMTSKDDEQEQEEKQLLYHQQQHDNKHYYYSHPLYACHVNEWMRRIRQQTITIYSSVWTWIPHGSHVEWNDGHCQTLLLKNAKHNIVDDDPFVMSQPEYVVVVLPCMARLDTGKLVEAIQETRQASRLLFNYSDDDYLEENTTNSALVLQPATLEDHTKLTGIIAHDDDYSTIFSMSPFGLLQPSAENSQPILFVLASEVLSLQRRITVHSGHAQLQLGMNVSDFCRCLHPLIADIVDADDDDAEPSEMDEEKKYAIHTGTTIEEKKVESSETLLWDNEDLHVSSISSETTATTLNTSSEETFSSTTSSMGEAAATIVQSETLSDDANHAAAVENSCITVLANGASNETRAAHPDVHDTSGPCSATKGEPALVRTNEDESTRHGSKLVEGEIINRNQNKIVAAATRTIIAAVVADVSLDITEALTDIEDEPVASASHTTTATPGSGCCSWFFAPKATKTPAVEWK